jgi:uncharacterized damage-inducible protein DinB
MSLPQSLLEEFQHTRRLTRDIFLAMTDGDVQFRPTPDQMAFGSQLLHILSCWQTLERALGGAEWNWDLGYTLEAYPSQAQILTLLDDLTTKGEAFWRNLEPEEWLREQSVPWGAPQPLVQLYVSWLVHEGHHRGQMVSYLRQKGMVPPPY